CRKHGQLLETPLGVAAGPQTQLAQNIIAAWLAGARFIELKTVQTLDEIEVAKPCIDMEDEGYNCEWSQELKLQQSFEEYLKAWIIIHVLRHKFGHVTREKNLGTVFNMSVGYSLEGILNDNVQKFFKNIYNSDPLRTEYIKEAARVYPEVENIKIPQKISDNLTLSTMHGCPPDEIEKICSYLISDLKLHTTLKLNPTLLGPELLRKILNEELGYPVEVPDLAFEHDLKYDDALSILQNLLEEARENSVDFGIKLTNTLETANIRKVLPADQKMHYMSGRSIHALAVNLARKLQLQFEGKLDISFSAGADAFNILNLLKSGLRPITVCSDLLKPGGYGRLSQYVENLRQGIDGSKYGNIEKFILETSPKSTLEEVILESLEEYSLIVRQDSYYAKKSHPWIPIKGERELGFFDCIKAPCVSTCPASQDIPAYMAFAREGDFQKALDIILDTNPLPFSTGFACDHKCVERCTRINYEHPLYIREIKRFIAENSEVDFVPEPLPSCGKSVGIIGGGPAGLSAAYYLAEHGFDVVIYEKEAVPGGMLHKAIPEFRLPQNKLEQDIKRLVQTGVEIKTSTYVDAAKYRELESSHDYLFIGTGAPVSRSLHLDKEDSNTGIMGFLEFLHRVNNGEISSVPARTVVIGGGNSALDAVRTAWRLSPEDGKVDLVYRRTLEQMPADREEIEQFKEEGIGFRQLVNPIEILEKEGKLTGLKLAKMKLGEPDKSGRRRPLPIKGREAVMACDLCIVAVGQNTRLDFLKKGDSQAINRWGSISADETSCKTELDNVYAGGDVIDHGPESIIRAIADGRKAAVDIVAKEKINWKKLDYQVPVNKSLKLMRTKRQFPEIKLEKEPEDRKNFELVQRTLNKQEARKEAERCLLCSEYCSICTTVCPNRANLELMVETEQYNLRDIDFQEQQIEYGKPRKFKVEQEVQIVNLGDFCNECGNCATFCPTAGNPYLDKPKFYLDHQVFESEDENSWHFSVEAQMLKARFAGKTHRMQRIEGEEGGYFVYETDDLIAHFSEEDFHLLKFENKQGSGSINMDIPVAMSVYLKSLSSRKAAPLN
ncbi:MAG: putative selenate reductase subunit YgfK, partial [Deltaproteobacteria bacterium]|nr:putative selenate reductase subunit YgfK [Deltaproteobacteria bacterium]